MAPAMEAVIFVPGLDSRQQGSALDRLVGSLADYRETGILVKQNGDAAIQGVKGKQIQVESDEGANKYIDVYEVFWGDLVPRIEQQKLLPKLCNGLGILTYWFFSGVWRAIRFSRYMTIGTVVPALLMLFWYYGLLAMALVAIGENPGRLGTKIENEGGVATSLARIGELMGGWLPWLLVSGLFGILPIALVVDIAYLTKNYLQNEAGLRDKITDRVANVIQDVVRASRYDRLTVLSHSFGVVVSTHTLSSRASNVTVPIRHVTVGGPLALLSMRSNIVLNDVRGCLDIPALEEWLDFYSKDDWWCTKTQGTNGSPKFHSRSISIAASFYSRIKGEPHVRYFEAREVRQALISGTETKVMAHTA